MRLLVLHVLYRMWIALPVPLSSCASLTTNLKTTVRTKKYTATLFRTCAVSPSLLYSPVALSKRTLTDVPRKSIRERNPEHRNHTHITRVRLRLHTRHRNPPRSHRSASPSSGSSNKPSEPSSPKATSSSGAGLRPLPAPALDPVIPSSSALWKANTSTSSTATSSSSRSFPSYDEWDDDEALSEPTPGEESYVPLTPAYFSCVLEGSIKTIMTEAARPSRSVSGPTSSSSKRPTSLIERLRAKEKENSGPAPGPTKEELLAWLRNSDERWARVGEWTVEEALQYGKREGRLWCVGKGRWEVCG